MSRLHFTRQMSCKCVSSTLYTANASIHLHSCWVGCSVSCVHFGHPTVIVGFAANSTLLQHISTHPTSFICVYFSPYRHRRFRDCCKHYCNQYQHTLYFHTCGSFRHPTVIASFAQLTLLQHTSRVIQHTKYSFTCGYF